MTSLQIKVPYKYRNVYNNVCRNKQLVILKQNKGRGVVLRDKTKYVERCFLLSTQTNLRS